MEYGFQHENVKVFPRMVIAGVSFLCNAKCIHCVYNKYPETKKQTSRERVFMDLDCFKKIADECAKYDWALLRLVGFGEPLLHPDCTKMAAYGKSVGCNVGLITNGSLLTNDKARELLECNIDAIDISVDAVNPATYENIRSGLSFEVMLENVRNLVELRNAMGSSTRIFGSIVEQNDVLPELDEALAFWGKIVDRAVSRKFLTFGLLEPDHSRTPYYENRHPCLLIYDRINVDVSGTIRLCGYDSFGKTNFGNIATTSIAKAWNSDELNRIRQAHQDRRFEDAGLCANCVDWPFHSWEKNYMSDLYKGGK